MEYTRGNDIVSALKYFYQNKYGISTETLAECRSIPEVICTAEKLQLPQNEKVELGSGSIEMINSMGSFYNSKKNAKPAPPVRQNKKAKRERFEEAPKVIESVNANDEENTVITEEVHA